MITHQLYVIQVHNVKQYYIFKQMFHEKCIVNTIFLVKTCTTFHYIMMNIVRGRAVLHIRLRTVG